ncbi:MAG: leucyl/phenylalanyl-tRNA--protein transferase [Rhodobacter sp.]|nr:leucyl/phenylalanyl-tRNA--protein transferase [Paracoccaceae bacterium]MCB1408787.1 leucyl/phenylalanyl-tRNA--protein transferase [Paracoccaceae bacterium]MCC0080759.1 leucyl/phenylalanyl-tRNA--protein transferase [Rhodobacter sp.]
MRLTPELIVRAYAGGVFPMAESADAAQIHWFEPRHRGVMPLEAFHVSRSLRKTRRRGGFRFRCDGDFRGVMAACADRPETWINDAIFRVFGDLHDLGLAHSIEVLDRDGSLAGGVYGLALGGAFFAESMVSRVSGGSKMALAELVARLRRGGYRLMDTQYRTPHLASLGGIEIPRGAYRRLLAAALDAPADPARAFAPANPEVADGAFWSEEPVDRQMPDHP